MTTVPLTFVERVSTGHVAVCRVCGHHSKVMPRARAGAALRAHLTSRSHRMRALGVNPARPR